MKPLKAPVCPPWPSVGQGQTPGNSTFLLQMFCRLSSLYRWLNEFQFISKKNSAGKMWRVGVTVAGGGDGSGWGWGVLPGRLSIMTCEPIKQLIRNSSDADDDEGEARKNFIKALRPATPTPHTPAMKKRINNY